MKEMAEENSPSQQRATEKDVRQLMKRKDEIEEQIKAYYDMLQDAGVGMDAALVDVEGFPRADVDLYKVRTARHAISCLQNDHKDVMVEIETALHQLHAEARDELQQDGAPTMVRATPSSVCPPQAFSLVKSVTQGSPAFLAGLREGDMVVEFGSVNTKNFRNLQDVASVVQHSEGKPLRVGVIRKEQEVHVTLTPQRWCGPGLLGCNLVPLSR